MSVDFERGTKVTGRKFHFLTGNDAVDEWTYLNEMIEYHRRNGYEFVIPPYMVNKKTAKQAGIYPRFKEEFYETKDGFIMIPTAETALVGMHSDEIIPEEELPKKYVAFSPCFRREAGSYGKRDRGLRRVHQFHKIELFIICKPEQAESLHAHMIEEVEALLDRFGVMHRRRELDKKERPPVSECTVDLEIFNKPDSDRAEWLEVSSISRTGENQSKPALIRYRDKGKIKKCELINGSGVALPRLEAVLWGL